MEEPSSLRSTKRKLDDAFQSLDNAVSPIASRDSERPAKRTGTIRSLYSTLAKYGIKSKETTSNPSVTTFSKSTPHLTAILTRAASRTKSTFSFRFSPQGQSPAPPLPATAEYRPSSLPSFISRLETYKLSTYANKPPAIDAVAAAKCGWVNDGKDRLVCGLCNASLVIVGKEGLGRDAANALVEKQRISLVESHKQGCPWRTRQCDPSIYCIPLQAPSVMIRDVKSSAVKLGLMLKDVLIKHPLTQSQLHALRSAFASYSLSVPTPVSDEMETDPPSTEPSETSVLSALFGWSLVSPGPSSSLRRSSTTHARAGTPSVAPTPSLSRASSVALPGTPTRALTPMALHSPTSLLSKPENSLLQCELCQRRIGLWAFTVQPASKSAAGESQSETADNDTSKSSISLRPKKPLPRRSFDLLKEHRSYCPYVVRSTIVPSLPISPTAPSKQSPPNCLLSNTSVSQLSIDSKHGMPNTLEGWKAVLTVVLRYGMAQRQRIEYTLLSQETFATNQGDERDEMDIDNVKAMVAGVKNRGGKDLLKYVRGLLG